MEDGGPNASSLNKEEAGTRESPKEERAESFNS